MLRLLKLATVVIVLSIPGSGIAAKDASDTFSIQQRELPAPADPKELPRLIVKAVDAGDFRGAAALLQKMKEKDPARYQGLPYSLLHAKMLHLSGDASGAYQAYLSLLPDRRMHSFILLPLARIAAQLKKVDAAIEYYYQYLTHSEFPEFHGIAAEALSYCLSQRRVPDLSRLSNAAQHISSTKRLGLFYLAKAYQLQNQDALARSAFLSLISGSKVDDMTSLALTELDAIDGNRLSDPERIQRGKVASHVWNFELVRKYLQPVANYSMEASYYYGRALSFLGEVKPAKEVFQRALDRWPKDRLARSVLNQYANLCLRHGEYEQARSLYRRLRGAERGEMQESVTYKLSHAFRAESKFQEAIAEITPLCSSRVQSRRVRALFLRSRIYYQAGRYQEALRDIDQVLQSRSANRREAELWKAIVLEKTKQTKDAVALFRSVASGHDFYALKAQDKLSAYGDPGIREAPEKRFDAGKLPDENQEDFVRASLEEGDLMPALLFVHLYEEAAILLPKLSPATCRMMSIDCSDRRQRYLTITYLAALGKNYSTSTYYSEMFQKNLPANLPLFSLSPETLKVLYPLFYKEEVQKFASERKLDPFMVLAIMRQESKFKRFARSQSFARGLMQLMPATASRLAMRLGINNFSLDQLYLPEININLGTSYLEDMTKEFGNSVEILAAGYNGGEANARRWLASASADQIIDFFANIDLTETKNYVMLVKMNYELYRHIYSRSN